MDNPPTQNRLMRFFSTNPLVGVIGAAASVISIPLAIFLYFSGQQTRDLAALVHPIRTSVVRLGQASKLSVKFEDRLIDSDVTAVQIAVWNRGGLAIRPTNVLKPVAIAMPGHRILEATIKKQTRDVVNFRLDPTNLAEGRVPLNWDILEQDDGAVIQLIYEGDDTSDITFEGVLEGQPSVSQPQHSLKPQRLADPSSGIERIVLALAFLIVAVAMMLLCITSPIAPFAPARSNRFRRFLFATASLGSFTFAFITLYRLLQECFGPPFGF